MKYSHIICHFSEIGLKGKNRHFFVKTLQKNIKHSIHKTNLNVDIINAYDRIILRLNQIEIDDINHILNALSHVFGIAYFCPVLQIEKDMESMKTMALEILKHESFKSFRITARMNASISPYSKMTVHEHVGEFIQTRLQKEVNLTNPDITCYIDTISEGTFIYKEKISGIGGMPVGTGGKGIVLLSGGIDSPVAAYYLLKRGMSLVFIHFHSLPHISPASIENVKELCRVLSKYQKYSKLILIPFSDIQEHILEESLEKYRVLLYRRLMLKIANKIAIEERARAIITGESLGQVASQTVENIGAVDSVSKFPVFRPLIGMDKQEIINKAKQINSYSISIRPHEDCCTLFLPQNPATKSTPEILDIEESKLDLDEMISTSIEQSEIFQS